MVSLEDMSGLKIGTVAEQAGVKIDTLRFYERQGVIAEPPRTDSNYRLYSRDTVRRVRFIKRAQGLGFSLREIKTLLELRAEPGRRCDEARLRALKKIEEIDGKIRSLKAMKGALEALAEQCAGADGTNGDCPLLDVLDENGEE